MIEKIHEFSIDPFSKEKRGEAFGDKEERLNKRLNLLQQERMNLSPAEAMNLRMEAKGLESVADFADKLADAKERERQENLKEKNEKEIKKVLMEQIGIPPEFVDQLALLAKAGPEALREGAALYRREAEKKRLQADMLTQDIEKLDKQIQGLEKAREKYKISKADKESVSMKEFISKVLYEQSLRDRSEEVLRQMLLQSERGAKLSNASR
jgi:hypothetical protein